jgi:hypothetical protein
MIEGGEHVRLAPESRQSIRIRREFVRQDFQRYIATELAIARTVDHSHSAFAEGIEHLV